MRARPTTYKGIRMRSRLEARYAAHLDTAVQPPGWRYEPRCFANEFGQYLPDFLLLWDDGDVYVEVKPSEEHATRAVLDRMLIIHDSEPDAWLQVVVPEEGGFRTLWVHRGVKWKRERPELPSEIEARWPRRSDNPELVALRLALDAERRDEMLTLLHEVLFAEDLHAEAFRALRDADRAHAAIEAADPDTAALLQQLATEKEELCDPRDVRRILLRLQGQREIEAIRVAVRAADDDMVKSLQPALAWLLTGLEAIAPDVPLTEGGDDEILNWLVLQKRARAKASQT